MTELPMGWGVLELAQENARQALARWDTGTGRDPDTEVAEALRRLIRELDAEHEARRR